MSVFRSVTIWLWMVLAGFSVISSHRPVFESKGKRPGLAAMEPGWVLIQLKPGVLPAGKQLSLPTSLIEKLSEYGLRNVEPAFPGLDKSLHKTAAALSRTLALNISESSDPWMVAQELDSDPNVVYAEPVYRRFTHAVPDDPQYAFAQKNNFTAIQSEAAWEVVKGASANVVVAIVDGGTDWRHPDLEANVWKNPGEIAGNGIDDDGNGFVDDVNGWNFANNSNDPTGLSGTPNSALHGTHVAGTVAAVTNNGIGVASISWNAKILPINAGSSTTDDAIAFGYRGIAYAAQLGAHIINCSWGSEDFFSETENQAIQLATSMGSLVVAAAGNGGEDGVGDNNDLIPHYPSNYVDVLSVGATNAFDVKAAFSNYGHSVDVFAPGVGILSTAPRNNYTYLSGTSMAAPMVAGLAALVKTYKPSLSPIELSEQVRVTANRIEGTNPDFAQTLGGGRVNAHAAVTNFSLPALRMERSTFSDANGNGVVQLDEVITLSVDLKNWLSTAHNVQIKLSSPDQNVVMVNQGPITLGTVNAGGNKTGNGLQFKVSGTQPDGYIIRLLVEITADQYSLKEPFELVLNPPRYVTHETGLITASITTRGNIGYNGFQDVNNGKGFQVNGVDLLFEGGLLLGISQGRVSDVVRGEDGSTQEADFQPLRSSVLTIGLGKNTKEETHFVMSDSTANSPLNVQVTQRTYADNKVGNEGFIVVEYEVRNLNNYKIIGLKGALFMDWDVANGGQNDYAKYDPLRRMGSVQNAAVNPTLIGATKLLNTDKGVNYRSINNNPEIYGAGCTGCNGFRTSEKWAFMSNGIQTQFVDKKDVSTLIGADLGDIEPGSSVTFAFALIGARSLDELNAFSDAAQGLFDQIVTSADAEEPIPQRATLHPVFPNPLSGEATLVYSVNEATHVQLALYDLQGRKIRALKSGLVANGTDRVRFSVQNLPNGMYFARLEVGRGGRKQVFTQKVLVRH
ncbi:MAG TPA: S8 family serine peptidase [Rhodothermales bacterium]|nr:S8 family serine peptidase [Rhodothermales bacterium]